MTLGLRARLFLVSLLLVVAALAAAEALLIPRLERAQVERLRLELGRLALAAGDALAESRGAAHPDAVADRLSALLGVRVTFIASDGRVLGDGEVPRADLDRIENHASRPEVRAALAGRMGSDRRVSATVDAPFLYVAAPPRGEPEVVSRVALPLTEVERAVGRLRRSLLLGALTGLAVAAALSTLATRLVARPLRAMTEVALKLAARRFDARVEVRSRDELGRLGEALNTLSRDLERTLGDLTRERDLLGAVLESMAEGVLVSDARGRVLRTNPALNRDLGVEPGPGGEERSVLEAIRSPELAEHVALVLAAGQARSTEVESLGPPPRVFRVSSAPLAGGAGVVTAFHDVTELRRLERVRRDFVANVSHELRTPVASIQAAGETLLGGALEDPASAREFVAILARNAERLAALVSDLLELARLEAGEPGLSLAPVALGPAVARALDPLAPRLAAKRLAASADLPAPLRVLADERALEQVLANLLDNAVKYTPEGGRIGFEAEAGAGAAEPGRATRIVVWDTGPGLEPRHRERVFERFYRVDPGRSRALGGTGLGLAIVKHLVEAMGGRVGVEPRPGGGSRFWFTLASA